MRAGRRLARQGGGEAGALHRRGQLSRAATLALFIAALALPAYAQTDSRDLRALRADLAALDARITRLEDGQSLERLQRAYGYYVDVSQFYDVTDLFAEDAVVEIGGRGRFVGKGRVFAYMRELGPTMAPVRDVMYNHQQLQPVITVAPDGETARARWTAFIMAGSMWGDATYENEYVKEDGVWKIKSLRAPFNMYADYSAGWHRRPEPNTRPESWLPPPDLPPSAVYLMYPSYYVAPFHYPNPVTGEDAPPPNPAAGGTADMRAYAE